MGKEGPPITMQPLAASSHSTDYQTDYGAPLMSGDGSAQVYPGLECLHMIDQVIIKLKPNWGCSCEGEYVIRDVNKRDLLTIKTEPECTNCGPGPYNLEMTDASGNVVIHYSRPHECFWSKSIDIHAPAGVQAGRIFQQSDPGCCSRNVSYIIVDDKGITRFAIEINGCECECGVTEFIIKNADGEEVGKISQSWKDPVKHRWTNYFTVSFPPQMNLRMKAVLIGAAFLMYNLYFNQSSSD